jgi:hypothetical protein
MIKKKVGKPNNCDYANFMAASEFILDKMLGIMIDNLPKGGCKGCKGDTLEELDPDEPLFKY